MTAAPGLPRQGVLHPVEGGRWSVTLTLPGAARPRPATPPCCTPPAPCATPCSTTC
ncbi:hypothetical protein N7U49_48735 (plasmid) [Streptomyces sp. AD2-2]|nr:hypothetical protein N7U49_48735 [Streptomyces sp. AD2-2]